MRRILAVALAVGALVSFGCTPKDPTADAGALDHVTKDHAPATAEPPKSQPDNTVTPTNATKDSGALPTDKPTKETAPVQKQDTAGTVVAYRDQEGKLLCPVMGSTIASEKDAIGYQDYKGVRYYFCCDDCPKLFKKDPEQWLKH